MGKIYIGKSRNAQKLTGDLLQAANLAGRIPSGATVGIKLNLVVAQDCSHGATTSPVIAGAVMAYLRDCGVRDITILEGAWVGDSTQRAFEKCGYRALAQTYGAKLVDTKSDSTRTLHCDGLDIAVCESALDVHYLINMPVLKGHCQTKITCALKNLKGCIPDREKRRFHMLGLHKPIAVLSKLLKQDFIVVDGLCGDLEFEEGGNPVQMDRVLVGNDPVLMDSYVASLLGYDPQEIGYITMAEALGVGSSDLSAAEIVALGEGDEPLAVAPSRRVQQLARYVEQNDACSACYANVIGALAALQASGELSQIKDKIHIGQGFSGKAGAGIGIGNCTKGFARNLPGCPPNKDDILSYLCSFI